MTIHAIKLNNFKKHQHFTAVLDDGLVAVTGANFSGKSTLLKAIMFALFGPTGTGHKADRIPTRGATDPTSVDLDIEIPVHGRVRIERTFKGAKVFAADGTLLANGTTPVIRLIEEAYGMAASDLQMLMYSKQGQSQALLDFGATALQTTIERLAKSDLVDKVLEMVGKDVNSAEGRIAGIGTPEDVSELQKHLQEAVSKAQSLDISMEEVTENIRQAQELEALSRRQLDEATTVIQDRKRIGAQLTDLTHQAHQLEMEIKEQRTTLEGMGSDLEQQAEIERSNIDSLQSTWMTRKQRADTAVSLLDRIEKRKISLDHYMADIKQSEEVRGALLEAEQEFSRLQDDYRTLKSAALQAKEESAAARKAMEDGVCRECKRPFSEEEQKAAVERHELAADRLVEAYQAWNDSLTPLKLAEEKLAKLKTLYKPGAEQAYEEVRTQLGDAEADLAATLTGFGSVGELQAAAEISKLDMEQAKARWQGLTGRAAARKNLAQRLDANEEQLAAALARQKELEAALSYLPEVKVDLPTVEQTLFGAIEHKNSLLDFEKRLILYKAQAEADVKNLTASLERNQKIVSELQTLQSDVDKRKRLQGWLRKSRAELMVELWDNMLAYASHLISLTTDGALSQVFREDGELFVVEEGDKVAVSELSGSQRNLLGLAIRLSMSRVFYGEDHFLLLDEVTDACDDNMAARVAGMLQSLGSQIILVTHRSGDSVNAGSVIAL